MINLNYIYNYINYIIFDIECRVEKGEYYMHLR